MHIYGITAGEGVLQPLPLKSLYEDDSTGLDLARRPTLRDVASRAGVSRSTASAVLNGACIGTRMSAATRERVAKAAAELSYRPNAVARSLRQQSMHSIGFYNGFGLLDITNPFLAAIVAGTHDGSDKNECDLLFHRHPRQNDVDREVREIISGKVDGVIVYAEPDNEIIDRLVEHKFPTVAIADVIPKVPSVTADDEAGARLIAKHLTAHGHKRAMFRMPPTPRASATRRCEAFIAAAKKVGIHVDTTVCPNYVGELSEEELNLLNAEPSKRPTAIACWNDGSALEAYKHYIGIGAWDRPAIIGYDGFQHLWLPATLTAVHVPWRLVAATAVDVVLDLIAGKPVASHTKVPVDFITGDTG